MQGQWQSHASDRRERAEALVNQRLRFLRPTGSFLTNAAALGMGGRAACHSIWAQLDLPADCCPSWDTGTVL